MTENFYLSGILTDFQLKLLDLIQNLSKDVNGAMTHYNRKNVEPTITLQYCYIVGLFNCSHSTVKNALDRLYNLGLIVNNNPKVVHHNN